MSAGPRSARSFAKRCAMVAGLALATAPWAQPAWCQSTSWAVTGHTVSFEIRNAGLPVHGLFAGLDARIELDPDDLSSAVLRGRIDASTVETGIRFRDRHLTGRQFFDVRRFPHVTMESIAVAGGSAGQATATFRLVIRDVERLVEVPFNFIEDGDRARLAGTLSLDRLEFGLGKPSPILADDVDVTVEIELERSPGG